MMKVVTTTRVLLSGYGGKKYPMRETLRLLREAGFQYLDWYAPECELLEDRNAALDVEAWKKWAQETRECAQRLGMCFRQMHSLELDRTMGRTHAEAMERLTDNALYAAAILGVRDVAVHPLIMEADRRGFDQCIRHNVVRLREKAELAGRLGLRLAVENMLAKRLFDGRAQWRFCTSWAEHQALVEAVDCENTGYCFDVGHANYTGADIDQTVLGMGERLFAIHVHDNDAYSDQHLLPYQGTVDYESFARALAQAHYAGDMTMEVVNAANGMPEAMVRPMLQALFEASRHLAKRVQYYREEGIGYGLQNR